MSAFEHIIVETKGAVGLVQINRPKMLNALSFGVFKEIATAIDQLEANSAVGCIVTGNEKASPPAPTSRKCSLKKFIDMFSEDFMDIGGDRVATCKKPTIAAVSGYARRRLRTCYDVRHHHRIRHRKVRTAGNHAWYSSPALAAPSA